MIAIHLDVLFRRAGDGRLVATRDPTPRPAPRVYLGRSGDGNAWAVHRDVEPAIGAELAALLSAEPSLLPRGFEEAPRCRARVLELLAPVGDEYRGPAYVLGDDLPRDRRAREVSAPLPPACVQAFPWLAEELAAVAPVVIGFEEGHPGAICHSPRGLTAAAAEAGVETLEAFRGRGLATAVVARWARAVQRRGRLALYSTSWENAASQAIARRLSGRLYGEDWHVA